MMLKHINAWILAFVLALSLSGAAAAAVTSAAAGSIPGQYIIVLKDSVSNPGQVASEIARVHELGVLRVYGYALKGFAATIPAARLARCRRTREWNSSRKTDRYPSTPKAFPRE